MKSTSYKIIKALLRFLFPFPKKSAAPKSLNRQFLYAFHIIKFKIQSMKVESSSEKRKYNRTTYEVRLQLITMVQKYKETIKNSAKMLNIKQSTAKLIVSRFRTSGTIYETTNEKKDRRKNQRKAIVKEPVKVEEKMDSKDHKTLTEKDHEIYPFLDNNMYFPFQSAFCYPQIQTAYYPVSLNQ